MRAIILVSALLTANALAEQPFLNEPDTGLTMGSWSSGKLPALEDIRGLPDFEAAARHFMNISDYSYYRTGAAGEFAYRASLDIFSQVKLRPRLLRDVSHVSLNTTILGYHFSAPFFIAPAANAGLGHPRGELNLAEAAGKANILYTPSLSATRKMEEIAAVRLNGQTMFHQLYVPKNITTLEYVLRRIKASGYKAIFVTVDNPAHGIRTRESRYGWPLVTDSDATLTWERYSELRNMTDLPIVPKGIQTVEDARIAFERGAPAIYLSNHGARQLDTSQSSLEIALEIYLNAPDLYEKMEIYADGGVRYGTDVLKLLALGVRAVGLGRPPLYANVFGVEGVSHMIELLKTEVIIDATNLGVTDMKSLEPSYLNTRRLEQFVYKE